MTSSYLRYCSKITQYIEKILNDNKSLIYKNNMLEEEIIRFKNTIEIYKQDNIGLKLIKHNLEQEQIIE